MRHTCRINKVDLVAYELESAGPCGPWVPAASKRERSDVCTRGSRERCVQTRCDGLRRDLAPVDTEQVQKGVGSDRVRGSDQVIP